MANGCLSMALPSGFQLEKPPSAPEGFVLAGGPLNDPRGAVLPLASGAVAAPASGIAGLAGLIAGLVPGGESPSEKANRFLRGTQDFINIDAPNPASQKVVDAVEATGDVALKGIRSLPAAFASFSPREDTSATQEFNRERDREGRERFRRIVDEGIGETLADTVLETTGSPGLATAARIVPETAGAALGLTRLPKPQLRPVAEPVVGSADVRLSGDPSRPSTEGVDITPPETIIRELRKGKPKGVADTVIPDASVIEAAQRLGISLNPEHYSTNSAFQDVARALKTQPGSKLQANEVQALRDLSQQADDLVVKNEGFLDRSEFSQTVANDINATIELLSERADVAYRQVRDAIPAQTRVDVQPIQDFIEAKLESFGGDAKFLSKAERRLLALTKKNDAGEFVPPTYAALDRLRKDVGEGFNRRSGPFKDGTDGNLREVYGVLSDTQGSIARAFGAGDLYDNARQLVIQRKRLEEDAVALFGRNANNSLVPKIRQAATGLTSGDVTKFNKLIESLPENRRAEAAATVLSDIFAAGSRRGGDLSQGFVSAFRGLNRNKEAKNALFARLPAGARKRFDDIGLVLTRIVESNRKPLGNPSGSATGIIKALEDLSIPQKIYEGGKKIAAAESVSTSVGVPGLGTAGVIGTFVARNRKPIIVAADELLVSPEFTRAINKAVEGDVSTANQIVENSSAFKKWRDLINEDKAQTIARIGFVNWLIEEENGL